MGSWTTTTITFPDALNQNGQAQPVQATLPIFIEQGTGLDSSATNCVQGNSVAVS